MHQWITTPLDASLLRGAIELEYTADGVRPHRLPAWARKQCPDPQLMLAEAKPSGVRLVFYSAATDIELDVLPTRYVHAGAPARPSGLYDLIVDGRLAQQLRAKGGDTVAVDAATNTPSVQSDGPVTLAFSGLPERNKRIEIWLPHDELSVLAALRTNARVEAVGTEGRKTWMHHGSSISQGSNGDSPTSIWTALAARLAEVELINLGFSGSALLDPFTARVMRDTPADFISVKMGINLVNFDLMRVRAFGPAMHGFIDTIRDGHPHTPLLIVSPLFCPIHEATPGPGAFDFAALAEGRIAFRATGNPDDVQAGKLTLQVIRDELRRIIEQRAADDPNLHYLDGMCLYGPEDHTAYPLPDALHPDGATHRFIGERFARCAFADNGPFSRRDAR
ncbi:SGNH/GDSL hydrolase family protein [Caballeronia sp. LZ065]|uniref:SGNH/GDSL hydrolase family protein n=1 Tax=Caballeronia sp. LZ065 TaxID=3038571 RepID=UPI0028556C29|nr:SGNH/GDSL hydrolase family protein [Caballeronia sp. LZ065]MDR5784836.1 SGNH/GDSL hydrolase family protein [Caballeronia sp. LZ065]